MDTTSTYYENQAERMHILLTGGAGFIGSHIVDAYVAAGHRVSIIDNFTTGLRSNLNPAATLHEVDIRDRAAIEKIFRENRFDLLNHHAAQLNVRVSVSDPQFDAEQNVIGTLNLLQGALASGVKRVIFASSGGTIYGEQISFPADETHPTDPIAPYGITKLAVEKYLNYYRCEQGIEHVILRYANVYGPRQNPHGEAGVVAIFCEKMTAGENPVIYGTGEQTRDYVYVEDVVAANVKAIDYLERSGSGTFNISSARETSVNELFALLNGIFGGGFEEIHAPARTGEQLRSVCSYELAARELGWSPTVELTDGLARTAETYRGG
jgi:UDP-glucose 4-epimerase